MRALLLALLKIVAVGGPLTWFWMEWGRDAYGELFTELSLPIYGFFGLTTFSPGGSRDRFINYLPFLLLMIITPRMTLRRRLLGTVIGFVVLFFGHVAFAYVAAQAIQADNTINSRGFRKIVAANGFSDAMPFVLWVIIAKDWVWERAGRLFSAPGEAPAEQATDAPTDTAASVPGTTAGTEPGTEPETEPETTPETTPGTTPGSTPGSTTP